MMNIADVRDRDNSISVVERLHRSGCAAVKDVPGSWPGRNYQNTSHSELTNDLSHQA
jgi:hypothetical protein